ncbi:MAG: alpha/beta hydrolase [Actinomycetota bacterium]
MATFERDDISISYDTHGDGFPVLLIAPGGMRSAAAVWHNMPLNPIEQLSPSYRVVAMDQRNAGSSAAPITADDGWATYTTDQLALLDHLGIDQFHVVGMCIGGSYIAALIKAAPERVRSAVVMQTIGVDENRNAFYEMFDSWAADIKGDHPEVDEATWASFRSNMYDAEPFLFTAGDADVAAMATPLLLLMGNDLYHPESSSRRWAELSPNATLIEEWKEEPARGEAIAAMDAFLASNTP